MKIAVSYIVENRILPKYSQSNIKVTYKMIITDIQKITQFPEILIAQIIYELYPPNPILPSTATNIP